MLLSVVLVIGMLSVPAFAASGSTSLSGVSFYVEANEEVGLQSNIKVDMSTVTGVGTIYLPGSVDPEKVFLSWDNSNVTVSKGSTSYNSGEVPIPSADGSIRYKVKKGALIKYYTFKTYQGSADVEPMFLELNEELGTIKAMNSDSDHETSCYGTAKIGDVDGAISIKGRGNSTWIMPKKPYNITFYKNDEYAKKVKVSLVDGVKAKKWTLLANYFDTSLIRNKIALDLANDMEIGLESKFVDLWMNGEYLGNYLLTPKKDYNTPDDGYFLENDHQPIENEEEQFEFPNIHVMPLKHNIINVDIGDDAADAGENLETVKAWFTEAWNAVLDYDSEDYQNYFDMESWAKMFLMFEVSKTYDCYAGNILMHRDGLTASDKLYAGPAWDYDIAFGRTLHKFLVGVTEPMQLNAEGWYNESIGYSVVDEPVSILQGLGRHESFMKKVAEVYNENIAAFEAIDGNITKQTELVRDSAMMNYKKYKLALSAEYVVSPTIMSLLGTGKYRLNYKITTDWDSFIYNLREFCSKRTMWLTDNLQMDNTADETTVDQASVEEESVETVSEEESVEQVPSDN